MPDDLLSAHKANDAAVEEVYGVDFNGDEEKIVAYLFKLYAEKAKKEITDLIIVILVDEMY